MAVKKKIGVGRHLSSIKRHRQSLKRRARNKSIMSKVRTIVKYARVAIAEGDKETAQEKVKKAVVTLQKAATKGVIPAGRASRLSSRLSSAANSIN